MRTAARRIAMRIAVSVWEGRVSPVFDSSRRMLVVDIVDGRAGDRREVELPADSPAERVSHLRGLNVSTLLCGAISRPLAEWLQAAGVEVHPFVAGSVEEVLSGYLSGQLNRADFRMPGCCGRRRRHCGGRGRQGEGR